MLQITGSGKNTAIHDCHPSIFYRKKRLSKSRGTPFLVLTPTRELAAQGGGIVFGNIPPDLLSRKVKTLAVYGRRKSINRLRMQNAL